MLSTRKFFLKTDISTSLDQSIDIEWTIKDVLDTLTSQKNIKNNMIKLINDCFLDTRKPKQMKNHCKNRTLNKQWINTADQIMQEESSSTNIVTFSRVDTFEEIIDRSIERLIFDISKQLHVLLNMTNAKIYWLFVNEIDHALINWFIKFECTIDDLNRFFRNVNFKSLHDQLNFKDSNEWKDHFHYVTHENNNNVWNHTLFKFIDVTLSTDRI